MPNSNGKKFNQLNSYFDMLCMNNFSFKNGMPPYTLPLRDKLLYLYKCLNLNVVQFGLFEGFLFRFQNVRDQVVVVLVGLDGLGGGQQFVGKRQLVGSDLSVDSGVLFFGRESLEGSLHDGGFFNDDVVKPIQLVLVFGQ